MSGSPVNIQLRWAKIDSSRFGGTDTWNLFYQVNSNATGTEVAWQNVGVNYTFGANGQMNPRSPSCHAQQCDGQRHRARHHHARSRHRRHHAVRRPERQRAGQHAAAERLPAGSLQQVSVNDKGRIVGTYSNGRTLDLAEITLANFNGANYLKRIDGGAFEVTDESGPAIYGASGKIVGSSLEGSNTDIADEFTKLIVTQQAYSANTRVITTSNQMVQDLLNMLR